jgi:pyruvate/2-oxoglutarate dehydrogenase complex dihydrolipoamide acyltransferase (E2) component
MARAIHLPKIGMTMEDAVLTRWLVGDDASVSLGDPIFEIDVEKVLLEVEAEADGTLRHLVGDCIRFLPGAVVGALLDEGESEVPPAILDEVNGQWSQPAEEYRDEEDDAPSPEPEPSPAEAVTEAPATPIGTVEAPSTERVIASPIARRLAAEHDLDLASVTGNGPRGRVTETDVRALLDGAAGAVVEAAAQAAAEPSLTEETAPIPYSGRRRYIGERMLGSLQSSAQLTLTSDVRVDDAVRMARGLSREWRPDRVVVTLTALVVRAVALALREHPALNSRLEEGQIVEGVEVNVGFAVDDARGLMVPVIRRADARPLREVAEDLVTLARKVESNELSLAEVTDATFTVTSLEAFGVDAFTPVLNPPQAAILGVGRVRSTPVVDSDRIEVGQVMTLSLTFDHRVTDGAPAARFLDRVAQLLGRPYLLI